MKEEWGCASCRVGIKYEGGYGIVVKRVYAVLYAWLINEKLKLKVTTTSVGVRSMRKSIGLEW